MDTLNLVSKFFKITFLTFTLIKCTSSKEPDLKSVSMSISGKENYNLIYKSLVDTFDNWVHHEFPSTESERIYKYALDSLICFNSSFDKLVTCRHLYVNIPDATSDDLQFFYGMKINSKWYFFKGDASIVIPRTLIKNHDIHQPYSYQELHKIALKEVYGSYLKKDGSVNEEWFTNQFEGPGWDLFDNQAEMDWLIKGKRFKTKKEFFEYTHLQAAIFQWANRDTTQPIKHLEKHLP